MPRRNRYKPAVEAEAIVHSVDPVNRELGVVIVGSLVNIYLPPNCDIVLRGERVKLRMVQPGDRVLIDIVDGAITLKKAQEAETDAEAPALA